MEKCKKLIGFGWLSVFGIGGLHIHGMEKPNPPDLPKYIVCQIGSCLDDRSASVWFSLNKRHYKAGEEYYKKIGEKEIDAIPLSTLYDEKKREDNKFLIRVGRFHKQIRLLVSKTKITFGVSLQTKIDIKNIFEKRNKDQIKYLQQAFWLETLKPIFKREKKISIYFSVNISADEGQFLIQNYGALRFILNELGPGYQVKAWYAIHCIYFKLHIDGENLEHPQKYLPKFISWKKIDIDRMVQKKDITENTYKRTKENINIFLRSLLMSETPLHFFFQDMEKKAWNRYWKKEYIDVSCHLKDR